MALFCGHIVAGQSYELKGKVRDQKNEVIPFASVFLLRSADSVLAKGTSADEFGGFEISNIPKGLYLLQASYIGWASANMALDISKDITIGGRDYNTRIRSFR